MTDEQGHSSCLSKVSISVAANITYFHTHNKDLSHIRLHAHALESVSSMGATVYSFGFVTHLVVLLAQRQDDNNYGHYGSTLSFTHC